MPSFDDLAHAFQQAQEEVRVVGSRGAQQRLERAARALRVSDEAVEQRNITGRQAAKARSRR